ncbi:hypothetical protein, conserved [Eimeria praecox]|uniref:Uncharacterized protein n=1 Tax=Eimeria praecox TaxID=51316 RepID=U6G6E4_9EIME|nr:hypothetical protein, conserved [Eimeria praecox]
MAYSKGTPAAEVTVKPVAPRRTLTDEGEWEGTDSASSLTVKQRPAAFNKPTGGMRQIRSMGYSERPPATKCMGRFSSLCGGDFTSKVCRSQIFAQKEDAVHTGSAVTPAPHGGFGKHTKNASPVPALVKAYDSTDMKSKVKNTLSKQFHSIASKEFFCRQRSAADAPVGKHEQGETPPQTDSQCGSARSSVEAGGPPIPPDTTEITARSVTAFAKPNSQVGKLASPDGAAEGSRKAAQMQSPVDEEEQTRDLRDGGEKPRQIGESGGSKNITTAEAENPESDKKVWQGRPDALLESLDKSNSFSKQLAESSSQDGIESESADTTAQKPGLVVVPSNGQERLSSNVIVEPTDASSPVSERLSFSKGDTMGS